MVSICFGRERRLQREQMGVKTDPKVLFCREKIEDEIFSVVDETWLTSPRNRGRGKKGERGDVDEISVEGDA